MIALRVKPSIALTVKYWDIPARFDMGTFLSMAGLALTATNHVNKTAISLCLASWQGRQPQRKSNYRIPER